MVHLNPRQGRDKCNLNQWPCRSRQMVDTSDAAPVRDMRIVDAWTGMCARKQPSCPSRRHTLRGPNSFVFMPTRPPDSHIHEQLAYASQETQWRIRVPGPRYPGPRDKSDDLYL